MSIEINRKVTNPKEKLTMKKTVLCIFLTFILVSALSLPNTFAQDYTQWGLPDGAKARLGKGTISGNIAYSPDGTRLAVASGIGIWLYDTSDPSRGRPAHRAYF